MLTPSKTRLKVGSVHVTTIYDIFWDALKVGVEQRLVWGTGVRVVVGSTPRVGFAML